DPKEQGQVRGLSQRPWLGVLRLIKVREFVNDRLGEADSAESADRDRVFASDQTHRLACRDDFARVAGSCGRNDLGNGHNPLPLVCRIRGSVPQNQCSFILGSVPRVTAWTAKDREWVARPRLPCALSICRSRYCRG